VISDDEREKMKRLCERIAIEQDDASFIELVQELNNLLEKKEERLQQVPSV
jgi:hypothetical protein